LRMNLGTLGPGIKGGSDLLLWRRFNKWPVAGAEQAVRACYREFLDEKLGRVIQISSEEQSCEVKET